MSRRPGSVGLGLYIAYEIDTGHGGTIDFTSTVKYGTNTRTRQTTCRCTLPTDSGLLSRPNYYQSNSSANRCSQEFTLLTFFAPDRLVRRNLNVPGETNRC